MSNIEETKIELPQFIQHNGYCNRKGGRANGDNSIISPLTCFKCNCIWVNSMMTPFEYEAKPTKEYFN